MRKKVNCRRNSTQDREPFGSRDRAAHPATDAAVFVCTIASGRAENDPAAAVQKAMGPVKKGRQPAITDLEQAREVLRHADSTPASPVTKLALRLLALTALRPGTLITTPWVELSDLDTETPIWQVPAARMKLRLQ